MKSSSLYCCSIWRPQLSTKPKQLRGFECIGLHQLQSRKYTIKHDALLSLTHTTDLFRLALNPKSSPGQNSFFFSFSQWSGMLIIMHSPSKNFFLFGSWTERLRTLELYDLIANDSFGFIRVHVWYFFSWLPITPFTLGVKRDKPKE
jgi:hypothetical protein